MRTTTIRFMALFVGCLVLPRLAPATDVPVQIHYQSAQIDGIDVFYREAGSKDAPVILLLHGFPTSSQMFRNLIPRLADKYHVKDASLLDPDAWTVNRALLDRPGKPEIQLDLFYDYRLSESRVTGSGAMNDRSHTDRPGSSRGVSRAFRRGVTQLRNVRSLSGTWVRCA